MRLKINFYFLLIVIFVFTACGGNIVMEEVNATSPSSSSASEEVNTPSSSSSSSVNKVALSGKVTYDFVPFASNDGLDYNNIERRPIRGAVVEAVDSNGSTIATTTSDSRGLYSMSIAKSQTVKIRVSAKLYKAVATGKSSWDFEVRDNTNANALYVMDGSLTSVGTGTTQTRNLNASSGWDGSSYSSTRTAASFSILDVVYQAMQKIISAQNDAVFPPLNIFWSKNNISANGDKGLGQITTSHYDGTSLYILGKENSDTDEYDVAVVAHEWSHYYEAQFSRSDSPGGSHGSDDMLDIRLAFGEGFGNGMSSIFRDDPLYYDTMGNHQASGWSMNVESDIDTNKGWFSENSIQRILYDVYDSHNDAGDRLSLGFAPIHKLLTGKEKNTPAFTSIFSFIKGLKDENPSDSEAIDDITSNENIAPITDIYGTGRTNRVENANPLYATLSVGSSVTITPNYTATSGSVSSRLGYYNFIKFTIPSNGNYTITAQSGASTDLDFYAYKAGSKEIAITSTDTGSSITGTAPLTAGDYRMEILDSNLVAGQTFTVTLN